MRKINENLYELAPLVFASHFPEYEDLGNGGIIITEDGVVIVDTDVRTVDRIFAMLAEITDKEIRYIINTHHAFDHSSANCIFAGEKNVTIIGSESCREAMIAHGELNFRRWSDRVPEVKKILEERTIRVSPPNVTFDHEMRLHFGGKTIELFHYGHAHSPGDIVIYLPEDKVLFAGDLLWVGFFPNVREANVPNQIKTIDRILTFPVTYYIPGHGGITEDRNKIVNMRQFLASLYDLIGRMVKEGKTFEEIRKIAGPLVEEHPDWRGRTFLTTAIEVIYLSLAGKKS